MLFYFIFMGYIYCQIHSGCLRKKLHLLLIFPTMSFIGFIIVEDNFIIQYSIPSFTFFSILPTSLIIFLFLILFLSSCIYLTLRAMFFLKHGTDFFLVTFLFPLDKCLAGSNLPKKAVTFSKSLRGQIIMVRMTWRQRLHGGWGLHLGLLTLYVAETESTKLGATGSCVAIRPQDLLPVSHFFQQGSTSENFYILPTWGHHLGSQCLNMGPIEIFNIQVQFMPQCCFCLFSVLRTLLNASLLNGSHISFQFFLFCVWTSCFKHSNHILYYPTISLFPCLEKKKSMFSWLAF